MGASDGENPWHISIQIPPWSSLTPLLLSSVNILLNKIKIKDIIKNILLLAMLLTKTLQIFKTSVLCQMSLSDSFFSNVVFVLEMWKSVNQFIGLFRFIFHFPGHLSVHSMPSILIWDDSGCTHLCYSYRFCIFTQNFFCHSWNWIKAAATFTLFLGLRVPLTVITPIPSSWIFRIFRKLTVKV